MVATRIDLREQVPANIVKWAELENTVNELFNTFEMWEEKNAELVNRFFNQTYFRNEESLIDKLIEAKPDIKFNDIEKEWINLALLQYDNWLWDFKDCLNKITNNDIKEAFMNEIFQKVQNKIWLWTPYGDFGAICGVPADYNVPWYFQTIVNYLKWKEWAWWAAKKTVEVLKEVNITNKDLNDRLRAAWSGVPIWINLSDPTVPADLKNAFDTLLSFEIGKEADRTVNISKDISNTVQKLLTNTFPAINTIIWESDEYKYDESKLWNEYNNRVETINNDSSLSEKERKKQIKNLKWEYYLKYLKSKNATIGNALQQLYDNNFDYSKVDSSILKKYLQTVADIRLRMLFDNWTNDILKVNFWNLNSFESFYKKLADPSLTTIDLKDVNIPWATPPGPLTWSMSIPVEKKISEWPNEWLKDIDEFWKKSEKAYDFLPIEYTIKKDDIQRLDITLEDREKLLRLLSKFDQWDNYVIKWENIWILIYLFFIVNSKFPITEMDLSKQKEIEDLFWKAKKSEHKTWENTNENERNNEENEEDTPEKFKEKIEKLWPWKFEDWSEIWLPMWESDLPGWWYQWMKIKISNIDIKNWTFKWTVFWWELKFSRDYEWKSIKFNMNEKTYEKLKSISKESDKIRLQPNPDKSDFNTFRNSLNNRLWTTNLSFPANWVIWNGNKFTQKIVDDNWKEKEVEVKYFWASSDDKSTYKIEYNPIRKSFTVSSTFNWDEKWKDWEPGKKRFSYKRDMDWNNFLIFFSQKWLTPQTEQEAQDAVARQDEEFKIVNGGKWKLNWFSINNITHWFKDIFWAIKKKIEEYNKKQDEKFRRIVEKPLLTAISHWPLSNSLKYAVSERLQEISQKEFNEAWDEIELYLDGLKKDDQFADTFDQVPPHIRLKNDDSLSLISIYWRSYKQFIIDLFNKKWETSNTEKRKAAALLLANIQKWSSPYRGLSWMENSWLWVKVILGNLHYEQFLRDKQKCINNLKKNWKEKDQIQDVLATCEMDYIINNITWANWKLPYFGSHEWRWIPGNEENTNYIPNPSKIILSEKFANELKNSYKWWFNKDSVESAANEIKHNDFNLAKEDFKRLIKSSRFPWAIANLKKMFLLAKTIPQQSEYQKCFLLYILSGVLDINGKKDLRKQAYQWAKTIWFLPGMLTKETWHSEKVVALMDDFCQEKWYWKFSDSVTSYFREWDLKKWNLKIDKLIWELDSRWDVEKMQEFEKYSKSDFPSKKFPENPVLKELQEDALNTWMENIDNSLLDNPVVANSWWLLSNANVVRDRMAIKDGAFDWKDPDERNNRALFRKKIASELRDIDRNDEEKVNFVLNQYFSWFGLNSEYDRQEAYEWINTAYHWRNQIWHEVRYKYNWREDRKLTMWTISPEDIKDILRYTFKWKVMSSCFSSRRIPSELNDALDEFQKFFEKAFDDNLLKDSLVVSNAFKSWDISISPMLLWSREVYKDVLSGGDNDFADDIWVWDDDFTNDKQRRKAQKKAFQIWWFINHKIAQIEKSLKKLPPGMYRPITQDVNHNAEDLIELL